MSHAVNSGRFGRTATVLLAVLGLVAGVLSGAPPAVAAPAATRAAAGPTAGDFGASAGMSADLAVNGWGDAAGYHVELGRESSGFAWREVAVLRPAGYDDSSWTGYQCLSGDGRFAAVAILPGSAVNIAAARDHGGFAYSVDLASGAVRAIAAGVGLKYYSPGCGAGDTAAFTADLGADQQSTRLLTADLRTGSVTGAVTVPGQVTSAVPTPAGPVGVLGSELVTIPKSGAPVVAARVIGSVYDLRPTADGGVGFLRVLAGAATALAEHERGGVVTTLGSGPLRRMQLFGGRAGHPMLAGADRTAPTLLASAGMRAVGDAGLPQGAQVASLDGDALFGPAADPHQTDLMAFATRTGKLLDDPRAKTAGRVFSTLPAYRIPMSDLGTSPSQGGKPQPHGDAAPAAGTPPATSPAAQTPTCAVPRLDPNKQVMQPSPAQVNWAVQLAEQGLLTGSQYTRPAGFDNLGLVAYAPNSDFPLSHPAGGGTTVPRSVFEAIMAQESNWSQASWHATKGVSGDPLIADYYGSAGGIDTINYAGADCGYGISQVTTGMHVGDTQFSAHGQIKIAVDYQENIAAGLQILESTWNQLFTAGIIANNGDPNDLENWYFAAWAYNTGIQPTKQFNSTGCTPGPSCTGPDGTWGLGWTNNPDNLDYPPNRTPFLQATYADAAHPGNWPYQERVMGWMAQPLLRYSSAAYATPTYHGGNTWLQVAPFADFCVLANNHCDPNNVNTSNPGASHCMLNDFECWWHQPVTWVSSCATTCATSAYQFATGSTEPGNPDSYPPSCSLDTSVVPGGAIIVDDQSSPVNLQGCGASNWSNNGSFTYTYGRNSAGDPIGAIDTHQLGSGLGGHVLFTHTETGANPAEINTGTWTPVLPSLQYYKIKIHFPALGAQATNVVYTINPGGGASPFRYRVNQAWNSEQWATIGTFAMENGANVVLTNQSADVAAADASLVDFDVAFDAIAFIPMGGTPGQPIGGPPGILDEPKGSNPAWVNCGCVARTAGDPVDTATGYFGQTWTDLTTPGRGMPLNFTRTYTESIADPAGPNGAAATDGPFGWGWTYSYNLFASTDASTGNVVIHQEDSSQVGFVNSSGTYTTAVPRFAASLVKSGSNYVYTRRGKEIFTFDSATGRLIAEQDLAGSKANPTYHTTLSYDSAGRPSTITDPAGRTYTLTWTGSHITGVADSAGRVVTYAYDASDNLTDVYGVGTTRTPTLRDNDHTQFTYNTAHLMTSMRAPVNFGGPAAAATSMTYDSAERVSTQTDANGHTTTFTYGPNGGLAAGQTLTTDPSGHKTLDTYANGLLTSQTKGFGTADAGTWSYTYDPVTLGVSSQTDPNGNLTTYSYDDAGNRISASNARGFTTNYAYDSAGNLIETIDPGGVATVNVYDQAGHVPAGASGVSDVTSTTITEANNVVESTTGNFGPAPTRTTNYYYDDAAHPGDQTRVVDPNGDTTNVTFDSFGDKATSTDGAGDKTAFGYNTGTGWLTSKVDPNGSAAGVTPGCVPPATGCTTYTRDSYGNITNTTDPQGNSTGATFDADGNRLTTTDANHNTTTNTYSPADQLVRTVAQDGTTDVTDYNPDGTVADTVDGLSGRTVFGYDGQGRQNSRTDPDGHATNSVIDPAGRVKSTTDPSGRVTTMSYDAGNDTIGVTYSDGVTPNVTFGYDANGNKVSMTDGTGTSTWTYDAFDEITVATPGSGASVSYGYDSDGNGTSITYPGQTAAVTRTFDTANRLHTVTDMAGNKTTFGYDADGSLHTTAYPNGTTVTNGFDGGDALTSTTLANASGTVTSIGYGRDPSNQVSSVTTPAGTQAFTYTARDQLMSGGSSSYAYDAAGNPTTVGPATQSFDPAGQLCWAMPTGTVTNPTCGTVPTGATGYAFDQEGNRTKATPATGTATTYGYDQAGRLTTFTGPNGTAGYTYDGTGLRTAKTVGGTTTSFAWDSASTPNLLSDGTNSYLYGPNGLPFEQTGGGGSFWFLHDQVGSTVALLDTSGAIAGSYSYTPYGVPTHTGTATTSLTYTGQYADAESGMSYLRARYYDPRTAEFLTLDPMVDKTGTPYAYVSNDPLNGSDPNGQCGFWCWTGIGAAVVGTAACIILEPCGLVEGGGLAVAGGGAAALSGGITFTGGGILAGGAAIGGLFGGGLFAMSSGGGGSGGGGDSGGGGGGGGSPADSSVNARPLSEIPDSTGCEEVAQQIQSRIGGEIYQARPPAGASNLGIYRGEDSFWANHEFVVKDGWAYDSWTGPEGEPLQQYKEEFEWWDVINFSPK